MKVSRPYFSTSPQGAREKFGLGTRLAEGWFLERKGAVALNGCMATDSAEYCMLVNEWVWSKSRDCLVRPEMDMGAVLESELGQKWR